MSLIPDGFPPNIEELEGILHKTDFSRYTDLKASLAKKLFQVDTSREKNRPVRLSDEEAELVSAAMGLPNEDSWIR